jgi:3-ketosteroid 9alpha-monooxygenase subunit A
MKQSIKQRRYAFEQEGLFARGWHIVLFSQELAVGQVKAIHYFDQDLVIYRAENGVASVLDAYCPHLGAHLGGTGSKVEGNNLRCPFHGWQFDSNGACVDIPYAKQIPTRAKNALKSWPTAELNGFIALWYDSDGGQPDYSMPAIPNWGNAQWGDWRFKRRPMKTHGREIVENIVDEAHFASVHGSKVEKMEIIFDGHTVTQHSHVSPDPEATMIIPPDLSFDLEVARGQ